MSQQTPNILPAASRTPNGSLDSPSAISGSDVFDEHSFGRMLALEQRRTERSKRRFALMLLDVERLLQSTGKDCLRAKLVSTIAVSTRDTDIKGWYKAESMFAVLLTEVGPSEDKLIVSAVSNRFTVALKNALGAEHFKNIKFSFHFFPEDSVPKHNGPGNLALNSGPTNSSNGYRTTKRAMDIIGSLCAMVVFSPLLISISVAIVLTSKGPVLFRQERIGQNGQRFLFLKFRSMYSSNDSTLHKEYVTRLIAGKLENKQKDGGQQTVYKLTNDPRVTPFGRFLRRTSLDELPQFFNVLKGDMSIVGPRPPVPYEFEAYELWHKRRMRAVKPGITGLWQVRGRSRVSFDEMVRLDLQYAKTRSPWLDLRIILDTPRAVISGDGAY